MSDSHKKPTVQILFPMGGLGTRFAKAGNPTPKPLILVDGMPMVAKALSSFDALRSDAAGSGVDIRLIFIVRVEHEEKDKLRTQLQGIAPDATFVMLDHDTRGAVETCLVAREAIDPQWPIVVLDCDLWFNSKAYDSVLQALARQAAAGQAPSVRGLLLYFNSTAPRYSFAAPAEGDSGAVDPAVEEILKAGPGRFRVAKTAEKVPISNCALIGAYGFSTGETFIRAADTLVTTVTLQGEAGGEAGPKEFYVSLLYNYILNENSGAVVAVPRDAYHSFGTPEELEGYIKGEQSHLNE